MKIDKNLWPIIAGMIAMFSWATMLCIVSVLYGPLGSCAGIHVGHYTIGNVSRYLDPFLLGVLVAFAIFAWQHQPPCWLRSRRNLDSSTNGSYVLGGSFISGILFILSATFIQSHFQINRFSVDFFVFMYFVLLLTPFGWRGVIAITAVVTLSSWLRFGLPLAMIFFFASWLGKWAIWWLVNIIKLGCSDTLMKLKSQHTPDHGSEGTNISKELSL